MGIIHGKKNNEPNYSDFCPLRIASLHADIDESINKQKKIDIMVEYFMRTYYGYNLDVFCIQGIRNYRTFKEIVSTFKKKISEHNDENRFGYDNAIYLEYSPDTSIESEHLFTNKEYKNPNYYDKLIISRHSILYRADIQLRTDGRKEFYQFHNNPMVNYENDDTANFRKYVQITNINIDGTLCSVYNVELEDDTIGISNKKERINQLDHLKYIIDVNREYCHDYEMRKFVYGDNIFVACDRNLHIVTGMFHINEVKNNEINHEYNEMCNMLNGFDTYKWVSLLKKTSYKMGISNIKYTKDNFTLLISKDLTMHNNNNTVVSQKLFQNHKTVIISSNITKNHVDMNQFNNFPEDTIFMLYRPNIEIFNLKNNNNPKKKTKKYHNVRNSNNVTQFLDQYSDKIKENKYNHIISPPFDEIPNIAVSDTPIP